jgi:hypothetical protein
MTMVITKMGSSIQLSADALMLCSEFLLFAL